MKKPFQNRLTRREGVANRVRAANAIYQWGIFVENVIHYYLHRRTKPRRLYFFWIARTLWIHLRYKNVQIPIIIAVTAISLSPWGGGGRQILHHFCPSCHTVPLILCLICYCPNHSLICYCPIHSLFMVLSHSILLWACALCRVYNHCSLNGT